MTKFEPIDVIASVVIIGCFVMLGMGLNGTISNLMLMVGAYYFGKRSSGVIKLSKSNEQR